MASSVHGEKETIISPHFSARRILILNTSICNLTYRPDNWLGFIAETSSRYDTNKIVSIEAVLDGTISLSRVPKQSQMFRTKKLNTNYGERGHIIDRQMLITER
jgi:hypothetical protein